jgi:spore germination protein GerM
LKKALLTIALLILPALLLIPGCGGTSQDVADAIHALQAQANGLETRVTTIDNAVKNLNLASLQSGVDTLKSSNAQLSADIAALKTQVAGLPSTETLNSKIAELNTKLAAQETLIAKLQTAITALAPTTGPATGQVTVAIDPGTPLTQILSSSAGVNPPLFRVTITNGTGTYQYISYSVSLVLINPGVPAAVTALPTLSLSGGIFGAPSYSFTPVLVPAAATFPSTNTQQVIFVPGGATPKIPVAAGQSLTIYHMLDLKTTNMTLWQGSITGVIATTTP